MKPKREIFKKLSIGTLFCQQKSQICPFVEEVVDAVHPEAVVDSVEAVEAAEVAEVDLG